MYATYLQWMFLAPDYLYVGTAQAHQERTYQEYCSVKGKEQLQQVEEYYKQILSSTQSDLSCILQCMLIRTLYVSPLTSTIQCDMHLYHGQCWPHT